MSLLESRRSERKAAPHQKLIKVVFDFAAVRGCQNKRTSVICSPYLDGVRRYRGGSDLELALERSLVSPGVALSVCGSV